MMQQAEQSGSAVSAHEEDHEEAEEGARAAEDFAPEDFAHVRVWVFDLDNTLYPARCNLFAQIDERMGAFVARLLDVDLGEARAIQKRYFRDYGTTLNGLMQVHGLDPDLFLDYVHDIDHSPVRPDPRLDQALAALPGRKIVFTNGSARHAEKVMERLGVSAHFDAVHDIVSSGYEPKPERRAYERFLAQSGIRPATAAFFEDIARNLEVPFDMGMKTVLVRCPTDSHPEKEHLRLGTGDEPYVDHVTEDLPDFLGRLAAG